MYATIKKHAWGRKVLAIVLTAVMVCALLPNFALTAWAADGGTLTNPTIINASLGTETLNSGYYELRGPFTNNGRLTVNGDVHLILQDGCDVTIDGGINCSTGNSLTIEGNTGKLTANNAPDGQAGIGGDNAWNSYSTSATATGGNITINGGIITATGGSSTGSYGAGAGIGGGHNGEGGNIIINGGSVTATGGTDSYSSGSGAGIGGGRWCAGGTIIIKGGTVKAQGGNYGAGIGGGSGGEGGNITIDGGMVTATGGVYSAGIGGSGSGSKAGGIITIGGGTVIATGGSSAAGIGGGDGGDGGNITIGGGTITATGGYSGAGVGGGASGAGGTITISGGSVRAAGDTYGAGIGGGWTGAGGDITIAGGTVIATKGSSSDKGDIGPGWYDNNGTVTISGGSVNCANGIVPRPTNAGTDVYLNQLYKTPTLNDAIITDIYGVTYGIDDVVADANGNLYFWLPASSASEIIAVSTDSTNFHGADYQRDANDNNIAELDLLLTREDTPNAVIDFANEELMGFLTTAYYTIDGVGITSDGSGNIAIDSAWFGSTLSIVRKTGDPLTKIDSMPQSLLIPVRPNAPGGLTGVAITSVGLSDGKITGTTALMEWHTSATATSGWQTCAATETTGFAVGTYFVRYKAVTGGSPAFKSAAATVTITDPLPKVYTVLDHFGTWTGSGTSFARVDADHTKLVRLLYGGAVIAPSNYTITQGSTIITLSEAHLQTYADGTHWFVAEYSDGVSENIRLDVNVASAQTPTTNSPDTSVPQTGDESNMTILIIALLASAFGLFRLIHAICKRRILLHSK